MVNAKIQLWIMYRKGKERCIVNFPTNTRKKSSYI